MISPLAIVENGSKISIEEIVKSLKIDIKSAFRHLIRLGFVSKCDTSVPLTLTVQNNLDRVSVTISWLLNYEKDPFLERIAKSDERWIVCDNVQRKRSGNKLVNVQNPWLMWACIQWSHCYPVRWDCRGIIHFDLLSVDETITAEKYRDQLTNLKADIQEKPLIMVNRKDVIFHHENNANFTNKYYFTIT